MEQVKQLLEILSQTPEMALWGLGIYFFFILLKLASWMSALVLIFKLFIKRLFEYKSKQIEIKEKELELSKAAQITNIFGEDVNDETYNLLVNLLGEMGDSWYGVSASDIRKAIKLIKEHKK